MHRYLIPPRIRVNFHTGTIGEKMTCDDLETRVKALETRMTYLEVDVPTDTKGRLELLDSLRKKIDHLMVETDLQNRRFDKLEKEIDDLRSQLSREISRGHQRQDQIDQVFKRLSNFERKTDGVQFSNQLITGRLNELEQKIDAYRVALHNLDNRVTNQAGIIWKLGERVDTLEERIKEERPWTK